MVHTVRAVLRMLTQIITRMGGMRSQWVRVLTRSIRADGIGILTRCLSSLARRVHSFSVAINRRTDELIADVVLGFMGFALVGGRLRELLPSDLRYPGAMARESLRAPGQAYANDTTRRELGILFKRYGCHTCGTRTGEFVGDHMPPNKVVHGSSSSRGGGGGIFRRGVVGMYQRAIYGGFSKGARQRYYPQCRPCSQLQAAAVQNNVKRLRLHAGFVGPTLVVGAMVALRHFGGADAKVQKRVRQWWNDGVKRLSSNSDSLDALILSVRE